MTGAPIGATEVSSDVQIVGYDRTPDPALVVASNGVTDRIPLRPGTTLDLGLEERHCAGHIAQGRHVPCEAPETPWCPAHTETWVCARCRGTCLKDEMDCHVPHVVYLAIVAPDAIKVGVTTAERIETRLHEQGADRGVVIHRAENGRIAREIEAEIGRSRAERITTRQKIRGLGRAVDEDAWDAALAEHEPMQEYVPEYSIDVQDQPIPETLATGDILGVKGRLLLLTQDGSTYATDLRDLVGHIAVEGHVDQPRQTGLQAFGQP